MVTSETTFDISQEIHARMMELAKRRYGDTERESMDKIISDALTWFVNERCASHRLSFRDLFWIRLTRCSIKKIKAIAWGKLLEPYFDGPVDSQRPV